MATVEGRTHAYHLVPKQVSKAAAVAGHARARGYDPRECIAVGDSIEDLEVAAAVGRFFLVANGPEHDAGLRAALPNWDNVTVTESSMGDGFYEAGRFLADGAPALKESLCRLRTRPSRSRSTSRSCSGWRRPGCR